MTSMKPVPAFDQGAGVDPTLPVWDLLGIEQDLLEPLPPSPTPATESL